MASFLLRGYDNKMCCLGQFSLQAGKSETEIRGQRCFGYESEDCPPQLHTRFARVGEPESIPIRMMNVNDDEDLSDPDRESQLTALALQLNPPCTLKFVN